MKIKPAVTGALKRSAEEAEGGQDARPAKRLQAEVNAQASTSAVPLKNAVENKTDSFESDAKGKRANVSISLPKLAPPKVLGIGLKKPLSVKNKEISTPQTSRKAPAPEAGRILFSGENPLQKSPYWVENELKDHAERHMEDTNSKSIEDYEVKSLTFMTSPVTSGRPAFVRKYGDAAGKRHPGEVLRHDREENLLGVARADGSMKTYHKRDQSTPGYEGLIGEEAEDHARGKSVAGQKKR